MEKIRDAIKDFLLYLPVYPGKIYHTKNLERELQKGLFSKLQPFLSQVAPSEYCVVHVKPLSLLSLDPSACEGGWFEVVVDYKETIDNGEFQLYRFRRTINGEVVNELDSTPSFSVVKGVLF